MTSQEPLIVPQRSLTARETGEDVVKLSVSEEEAAEFSFDIPSTVVLPAPVNPAPVSYVVGPLSAPSGTAGSSQAPASDTGPPDQDVDMNDSKELKLVVETPPSKPAVMLELTDLPVLYRSLAMDLDASPVLVAKYRLETLHLRGIDEMSTEDILNCFTAYKPTKVEWINDTSCNVVFPDEISSGSALKALSKPLKVTKKPLLSQSDAPSAVNEIFHDADTGEEILISDVANFPIPVPQGTWRVARTTPRNAKQVIMRFARTIDKKPPNAQMYSQYYAKYGNPNYTLAGMENDRVNSARKRSWLRRLSSDEVEDHEPFGLYANPSTPPSSSGGDVLEVDQRPAAASRRKLGLYADHHDVKPYTRPRTDSNNDVTQSQVGSADASNDLRSLLQQRGSVSHNDLRHRLSQPTNNRQQMKHSDSDLRVRLNKMRKGNNQ